MISETTQTTGPGEFQQELRIASDQLLATLDELVELETTKRSLQPGTEEFIELAGRIEGLAAAALIHTHRQDILAHESQDLRGTEVEADVSIEATSPRTAEAILSDWRSAERKLQGAEKGSTEASIAEAEVRRLRDEYRRAQVALRGAAPD